MRKLPVFATIGRTFGFVIERRFFTLLRLVWFPSFLTMLASMGPALYLYLRYGQLPQKVEHRIAGAELDVQVLTGPDPLLAGLHLFSLVAQIVLGAVIAVAIHRLILLDDRRSGAFFYLRLSGQELLYMLAWILYFVAIMLAFAPFIAHVALTGYQAGFESALAGRADGETANRVAQALFTDPRTGLALGLAMLLSLVVLVRFGLTFPVIVAEDRLSFARSWELTRGNFWRLLAFWILTGLLGWILLVVMLAVGATAIALMAGAFMLGGELVGSFGFLVLSVPAAIAFLVYFVVAVAIFVAALSFTYRALAGDPGEAA